MRNNELAYVGDQIRLYVGELTSNRRRRVGVGEFVCRLVDWIPLQLKRITDFVSYCISQLINVHGLLVSKETVVGCVGGGVKQKFGFIKRVDKG